MTTDAGATPSRFGLYRSRRMILLVCPLCHVGFGRWFVGIGPGGFAPCWLSVGKLS